MSDQNTTPQIPEGYWRGPAGVLVPTCINKVEDMDQKNTRYDDTSCIEMVWDRPNVLTVEEYRKKYARCNPDDGNWYYCN